MSDSSSGVLAFSNIVINSSLLVSRSTLLFANAAISTLLSAVLGSFNTLLSISFISASLIFIAFPITSSLNRSGSLFCNSVRPIRAMSFSVAILVFELKFCCCLFASTSNFLNSLTSVLFNGVNSSPSLNILTCSLSDEGSRTPYSTPSFLTGITFSSSWGAFSPCSPCPNVSLSCDLSSPPSPLRGTSCVVLGSCMASPTFSFSVCSFSPSLRSPTIS